VISVAAAAVVPLLPVTSEAPTQLALVDLVGLVRSGRSPLAADLAAASSTCVADLPGVVASGG
jgi:xanthosine utilization system XapX-like protein